MIIDFKLNTDFLKVLDINLKQLLFVDLLFRNTAVSKLKLFLTSDVLNKEDFENLKLKNILRTESDFQNPSTISFVHGFKANYKSFGNNDLLFDEFHDAYPSVVTRPSGEEQYLKASTKQVKKLYHEIIKGDKEMHAKLCRCIKAEVAHRELAGGMPFMKNMRNWLLSEEWVAAEAILESSIKPTTTKYGGEFL